MAAGDITALTAPVIDREVVASATAGTTVFVITDKGRIHSYTISGQANALVSATINERPTAMATLGTNLYVGTDQGNIYKVVMATGVTTTLAGLGQKIQAMCMYGTLIYVTLANNTFKSVAIS